MKNVPHKNVEMQPKLRSGGKKKTQKKQKLTLTTFMIKQEGIKIN